jgi:hypothetical protein
LTLIETIRHFQLALLLVSISFAEAAAASTIQTCLMPGDPGRIPDGGSATRAQMLEAKQRFDSYNSRMNSYLECINTASRDSSPNEQQHFVGLHNAGVELLETRVGCFNDQLKKFKETGGGDNASPAICSSPEVEADYSVPKGADPQVCAQFLDGIRNNCPYAAGGGPPAIYCGTSRSMYISSGCDQSAFVDDSNVGSVTVNIQNGGQRSPANATPLSPRAASQIYAAQNAGASGAVYDKGLDQCVKIGGDGQSVYFENGCNASLTIAFNQAAGAGLGMTDCGPASRCTFGVFGVGYSGRNNTLIAVCPKGDYVESAPGVQWAGSGPFRCRRP